MIQLTPLPYDYSALNPTISTETLQYHYDGPYINKRNLKRFLNKAQLENEYFIGGNCDHEIYLIKCKYLYHRVREKYTDYWWD